jgi:hypothetical protein
MLYHLFVKELDPHTRIIILLPLPSHWHPHHGHVRADTPAASHRNLVAMVGETMEKSFAAPLEHKIFAPTATASGCHGRRAPAAPQHPAFSHARPSSPTLARPSPIAAPHIALYDQSGPASRTPAKWTSRSPAMAAPSRARRPW